MPITFYLYVYLSLLFTISNAYAVLIIALQFMHCTWYKNMLWAHVLYCQLLHASSHKDRPIVDVAGANTKQCHF